MYVDFLQRFISSTSMSILDCLEHKLAEYMLITHDKRVQVTNNQYVSNVLLSWARNMHCQLCSFVLCGQHVLSKFVLQAVDMLVSWKASNSFNISCEKYI